MHDPNKNRALCVIAKTGYWSFRVTGWFLLVLMLLSFAAMLIYKAWANWNWRSIGKGILGFTLLFVVIALPTWGVGAFYNWAKRYRRRLLSHQRGSDGEVLLWHSKAKREALYLRARRDTRDLLLVDSVGTVRQWLTGIQRRVRARQ